MRCVSLLTVVTATAQALTAEEFSVSATCTLSAPFAGLTAAVCPDAAAASASNNYCLTSDVFAESLDGGKTLTIVSNNCPNHVWGGQNVEHHDDDWTSGGGCGCSCAGACGGVGCGCDACSCSDGGTTCDSCSCGAYDSVACGTTCSTCSCSTEPDKTCGCSSPTCSTQCDTTSSRRLACCSSCGFAGDLCTTCGSDGCDYCSGSLPCATTCDTGACAGHSHGCCSGNHHHGCGTSCCGSGPCGSCCAGCGCAGCGCGGPTDKFPRTWPLVRDYKYEIPLAPTLDGPGTALDEHDVLGIAANGVELTAGVVKRKFDNCTGHVLLATQSYHYHAAPSCLLEAMGLEAMGAGAVVGWALDGFAIRSGYADGVAPADLDECHGMERGGAYAYYLTSEAPHGPTCLRGAVGVATNDAPPEQVVCPKEGKEVSFELGADVEGHACAVDVAVTGYLVDAATWTAAEGDPAQYDLRSACPGACAFGVVVESARRRLADGDAAYELKYVLDAAGNEAAAAAVAAADKTEGWLVDVRGGLEGDTIAGASVHVVGEVVEAIGVVLDMQCWWRRQHPIAFDGVDMVQSPGAHAVWCLRDIPDCRNNGFGIMTPAPPHDVRYSFAEATNAMMVALIDKTAKEDQVVVKATGAPVADALAGAVNDRNFAYEMFEAEQLVMVGETVVHEGFLVDLFCWDRPGHVAIDGADLDTRPERHTIHCMRDIPDCRANGFAVLEQLEDGTYGLAYRLDAAGNEAALAYVDSAPDGGDVVVRAVGTLASRAEGLYLVDATIVAPGGDDDVAPAPPPAPEPTARDLECESDDPAFAFRLMLASNLAFYWSVEETGPETEIAYPALRGRLVKSGGGWGAVGFSPDGLMVPSDAVVGEAGALPRAYRLSAKSDAGVRPTDAFALAAAAVAQDADGSSWDFVRALDAGSVPLDAEGTAWGSLLWAEGGGGLGYHRENRGAFKLDFTTCDASAQRLKSVNSKAIKVHGALMIAAWAYLSPFAVVAARSKNSKLTPGTLWLKVHAVFQLCALVLTAAGLAKAIMAVGRADGVDHLSGRHQKLGVGVGVAAGVNLLMGALRPHAPGPDEDKTALRLAFEVAHRLVGYGAVVLGAVTMFAGVHKAFELDHISQVATWNAAIVAPLAVSAFLIVALTAYINFVLTGGASPAAAKAPGKDIP